MSVIMSKGYCFLYECFVKRAQISDLLKLTILLGNNEGGGCPFRGPAWFRDTKIDYVVDLIFEGLSMDMRNRVSVMMHWLSSGLEVNVNLLCR